MYNVKETRVIQEKNRPKLNRIKKADRPDIGVFRYNEQHQSNEYEN